MSTLNLVPKIIYDGNGIDTGFDFPFPAINKTDIQVYVYRGETETEIQIPYSQFDFNKVPTANEGGRIIYPVANSNDLVLGDEDKICIMRSSRLGNDYVFTNQTRLLPSSVEDADDALSLQIMELARDLQSAVKASPFDTRTPQQRWSEILSELKRAQETINYINEEYLTLPQQFATEKQERIAQDAAINSLVARNKEDCNAKIADVLTRLAAEAASREQGDLLSVKKETVPSVVSHVAGHFSDSSVSIVVTKKDSDTGSEQGTQITLPVASEVQHGVMPKEAYASLADLGTRVSSLEGGQAKSYALHLGEGPFSQEDYQLSWENAAGVEPGSVPPDGTKITNLDTNIDIQYFAVQGEWIERQVSVPLATLSTTGVVKGSTVNGQVAVEQDGSMSLNGYDALVLKGNNNASAVSAEENRAKSAETSINQDLQSHKGDTTVHITEAERTSWNGKYSKLDSGIPAEDLSVEVQGVLSDAVTQTRGGTMGAKLVARSSAEASSNEVRNISFTDVDPGVGAALATGSILMVFE